MKNEILEKHEDHYLFKNSDGEYHISLSEYERMGRDKSLDFARAEIQKKKVSSYSDLEIDFKRARALSFCEYGIKDFCENLNLNTSETYKLSDLSNKLTTDIVLKYPDECLKLFGKNLLDNFGGPENFLRNNKGQASLSLIMNEYFISERTMHILATKFSLTTIDNYEKEYPGDDRPRKVIEAKQEWLRGEIGDEELEAARSAARSAVRSAARSAAWSAAESAAWSAAWSAWSDFADITLEEMKKEKSLNI